MYQRYRSLVLHWFRVPPDPHPPYGDPASLRVFRAAKNYFYLRLFGWGLGQLAALAGIIFWLVVFLQVEDIVRQRRLAHQAPVAPTDARSFAEYAQRIGAVEKTTEVAPPKTPAAPGTAPAKKPARHVRINGWAGFKLIFVELALWLPLWAFPLLWVLKLFGLAVYLVQIPLTYAIRRLDFELHWYIVTDRSLRIRTGLVRLQETTMSFANLQQVEVKQGPLQRLLGLADVHVQSAGGGGNRPGEQIGDQLHTGIFHSVNNATEIRDLILERLRRFRQAGLGDPDDHGHPAPPPVSAELAPDDTLAAAREVLAEARALRAALG